MLSLLVLSAVLALSVAQPPQWHNGPCGRSRFADAGNQPLPPPTSRKVVGGIEARPWEFPWQTSLRRRATNSHFCGGFIINNRWIMSAAHCASGETPAILVIVIGDHTRNDLSNTVRQTHDVDRIHMHEQYNARTLVNDIALTRTVQTLQFNDNIQPVCGPEPTDQYAHRRTVASGWGTLFSGGPCCPQTLQYVSMNITTNAFCSAAYPIIYPVTADMICASDNTGGNERDTCQGDSGGPLVVQDADGTFRVVGIVSWGIGCASGYPGVYARVGYQHNWVLDKINAP